MNTARELVIRGRQRANALGVASSDDFVLEDAGLVPVQVVLDSDNVTPYCFDVPHGRVLFVETPAEMDLSKAPFLYEAQYRHAQRVYAVQINVLNRIGDELPDPPRLLLIHSTGRCGSTLLTAALAELEHVAAVSEPDIFTQLAMAGIPADPITRKTLIRTLRSCIRVLCRSRRNFHVIKFRSVVMELSDLLSAAVPTASNIFVYRDAVGFARSTARILHASLDDWRVDAAQLRGWLRLAPLLGAFRDSPEHVRADRLLACLWAGSILRYLDAYPTGLWLGAVRYENLLSDPGQVLSQLFSKCAIPALDVSRAILAWERDSQAGTSLARERLRERCLDPMEDRHVIDIHERLREIRSDLATDLILPGTIGAGPHARKRQHSDVQGSELARFQ